MRYKQHLADYVSIADGARLIQERSELSENDAREDIVFAVRDRALKVRCWRTARGERSLCRTDILLGKLLNNLIPDLIDWESSIARRRDESGYQFEVEIEVSRTGVCRLWPAPGGVEDRNDERPEDTLPYIKFMLRAAQKMGLKPSIRTPKKTIEAWLRENWHDQLGELTERKIKHMATSLRQPKDELGGYFKPNRDE